MPGQRRTAINRNGTDLKRSAACLKRSAAWERLPGAIEERIAARCRSYGGYGSRLSQCHCN